MLLVRFLSMWFVFGNEKNVLWCVLFCLLRMTKFCASRSVLVKGWSAWVFFFFFSTTKCHLFNDNYVYKNPFCLWCKFSGHSHADNVYLNIWDLSKKTTQRRQQRQSKKKEKKTPYRIDHPSHEATFAWLYRCALL